MRVNIADPGSRQGAESGNHVCPVSAVRSFDNLLRPFFHDVRKLFGPHVEPGMTVLDVGCGGGWASLGLARLVGEDGLVISADLQPGMLELVLARAEKAGLTDRVRLHRCGEDRIGLAREIDFAVAFWMAHEVPDSRAFTAEVHSLLKPGGRFFVAEPKIHVPRARFERMVVGARQNGFRVVLKPRVSFSRAVVLEKQAP